MLAWVWQFVDKFAEAANPSWAGVLDLFSPERAAKQPIDFMNLGD
jgi:hypothetical protein